MFFQQKGSILLPPNSLGGFDPTPYFGRFWVLTTTPWKLNNNDTKHTWLNNQTNIHFSFQQFVFFWVVHLCEISGPPTKSFSKRLATNHPKRAAFSEAPRIAPGGENSAWAGRKPPRSKHRRCERLTGNLAKVWLEMAWGVGGLMSPIFRHEFNLGHLEGVKSHRNWGDETDDHHGSKKHLNYKSWRWSKWSFLWLGSAKGFSRKNVATKRERFLNKWPYGYHICMRFPQESHDSNRIYIPWNIEWMLEDVSHGKM